SGYVDPGVPEVQIYMHRVFMNIARNYQVDGIHLDFVRYPGATWGYSQSALDSYAAETGATATPDPSDPQWQAWRRARVTGFVRDLHHDLQEERPSIKLSGALICFGAGAFLNYPEDTLAQIRRVLSPSTGGHRVLGVAIYSYASSSVYGTDDFYTAPDLAAGLPRQPYAGGLTTEADLASRARTFNESF